MSGIIIPDQFDGAVFAEKYNLNPQKDFRSDGKNLICPSLPGLTEADLLDCLVVPKEEKTSEIFNLPVIAPDFIVQSPKPKKTTLKRTQKR